MRSAHTTLADIAQRAGVTTATVSLALRHKPNVAAATRERILSIARALNYRPNPYVSALMRMRRSSKPRRERPVVALVTGLRQPDAWRKSPSLTRRQIYEGAAARIAERGYASRDFWLFREGMSGERFSTMLHARGIGGLLLGPLLDGAPPPLLRWELFTAVSLSVPLPSVPLPTVSSDHFSSVLRAVAECRALGYRRPGLVMREGHRALFKGRVEGGFFTVQHALTDLVPLPPLFTDRFEDDTPSGLEQFRAWVGREKPNAILTLDAPAVERLLARLGLAVPDHIALASLSCPMPGHRLSGVYQNGRLIGATAADFLIGMMERGENGFPAPAVTMMVEGQWNPGKTLPPLSTGRAAPR